MKNRLSNGADGRYPPTNNQLKHYAIPLIVALFSGMLANAFIYTPATTNNDLDLLKGKVETARVIQKTKQEQNNVLDVSDKFKKSRDFLAMQTPVDTIRTAEEAKRVYEEGLRLQEKFQGVAKEDYEQVLAEQGMTLESFHDLIIRLNQAQTYFVNEANDEGHWRQKQGKNYKYIAKSSKEAQAGYIEMGRKINQLIHNLYSVYKYLKAKPQREALKDMIETAEGKCSIENKSPEVLEMEKKLGVEIAKVKDGKVIDVLVNGKYKTGIMYTKRIKKLENGELDFKISVIEKGLLIVFTYVESDGTEKTYMYRIEEISPGFVGKFFRPPKTGKWKPGRKWEKPKTQMLQR